MNDIGQFVSQVGFPVAVAIYLLVIQTKTLGELTRAINKLIDALAVTATGEPETKKGKKIA